MFHLCLPEWNQSIPCKHSTTSGSHTGVHESPSLDLKIYPNPADGFFQIESPENGTLRIYNLQGQQMLEEQINSGGVQRFSPDFNPGIYLLELRMKNGKVRVGKLAWL